MNFRKSFTSILIIAFLIRLAIALLRTDMHWPDEHFQTLEPASLLVNGYGFMTWEWQEGYRSWITPTFFMPWLWLAKLFGATGGLVPIFVTRVLMVVLSLGVMIGLDRLAKRLEFGEATRLLIALVYALSVPMILWAPSTLADTLVTAFWWFLLPVAFALLDRGKGFQAGMWVAVPWLFRPQMGLLGFGFWIAILFWPRPQGTPRVKAFNVALGGSLMAVISGIVDWATLGVPFGSLYQQLTEGLKKSEFYGVSPWWDYFRRIPEDQSAIWIAAVLVLVLAGFVLRQRKTSKKLRSDWTLILLPLGIYFAVHCGVKHKETRFIQILFPLFFLTAGWGFDQLRLQFPVLRTSLTRVSWPIVAILLAPFVYSSARMSPLYLTSVDVSVLMDRIYREEKSAPETPLARQCVLFVDSNWSFTRGALGMGRKFAGVDRSFEEVSARDFKDCGWVIAKPDMTEAFDPIAAKAGRSLIQIQLAPSGFALYR